MLDIVIATRNVGKARELAALLRVPGVRWRSLAEFPSAPDVVEDAPTFQQNAEKKARSAARFTSCLALADDSGLEVDALDGRPGVRSARFAGPHGQDLANNAKLLRVLQQVPSAARGAQFRCILIVADHHQTLLRTEGLVRGVIVGAPMGQGGFGYDSLFFIPSLNRTLAQVPPSVKHRLSHRGQAARRMNRLLFAWVVKEGRAGRAAGSSRTGSLGSAALGS